MQSTHDDTHADLVHEQATGRSLHGLPTKGARLAPQLLLASLAKRVAARTQNHQGTIFLTDAARSHEAGIMTCTSICGPTASSLGRTIPGRCDFEKIRAAIELSRGYDNVKAVEPMALQSLQQRLTEGLSLWAVRQRGGDGTLVRG